MMKRFLFPLILSILLPLGSMAQSVTLTFTGKDANNHQVPLDKVVIKNLTQNWEETLVWPDTTLTMGGTGIENFDNNGGFALLQNSPNPFNHTTNVFLNTTDAGTVTVEITDVTGRVVTAQRIRPQIGQHQFRISLSAAGTYVMTARQNGKTSFIKMVNNGNGYDNKIDYVGTTGTASAKSGIRGSTNKPFNMGDQMKYVGHATINGIEHESQPITQSLNASQTISLFFSAVQLWKHCPGAPTLTDIDNNVYNTVQIGQQCWMKENLRTTKYADNTSIPEGSSSAYSVTTPYRYAPNNSQSNVSTHGYLYNWAAVMHEDTSSDINPSGVQGICPTGWHVPSDAEWTQLTDYVKSQSAYRCGSYTNSIAKALAATTGWNTPDGGGECAAGYNPNTNNATGFSALAAGCYDHDYADVNEGHLRFGYYAYFWSSTEYGSNAITHFLYTNSDSANRNYYYKKCGHSVRCVKD